MKHNSPNRWLNPLIVLAIMFYVQAQDLPLPQADGESSNGLVGEVRWLREELARLNASIPPIGAVVAFGGSFGKNPEGEWVKCDGRKISREKYPELFAKLKTLPGTIKNCDESEFRTPNYTNRFLRHTEPGSSGGAETVETNTKGGHDHGIVLLTQKNQEGAINTNRWFGDDNHENQYRNGSDGAHNHEVQTMPPWAGVYYFIRGR